MCFFTSHWYSCLHTGLVQMQPLSALCTSIPRGLYQPFRGKKHTRSKWNTERQEEVERADLHNRSCTGLLESRTLDLLGLIRSCNTLQARGRMRLAAHKTSLFFSLNIMLPWWQGWGSGLVKAASSYSSAARLSNTDSQYSICRPAMNLLGPIFYLHEPSWHR